ncbi:MAG TPA: hypothetical protein VHT05_09780 [Candidatus Elarobacter sp.]|jgi:hypothetical protein|nr:hypothetical protein [Candidatus Elarobacter sp.]
MRFDDVPGATFLPGLVIDGGTLVVDRERLLYPGDLLHESGHLAVMFPARRARANGNLEVTLGDEICAIGWSYAAALAAGIDAAIVFHAGGYRGASNWFVESFAQGRNVGGVPMLQYLGLTYDDVRARERGVTPYPAMRAWRAGGPDEAGRTPRLVATADDVPPGKTTRVTVAGKDLLLRNDAGLFSASAAGGDRGTKPDRGAEPEYPVLVDLADVYVYAAG